MLQPDFPDSFYAFYRKTIKTGEGESNEQAAALALVLVEGIALLESLDFDPIILKAIEGIEKGNGFNS
ncbi:hypothetical protein CEF21_05255 [Bacillus sp. FJAT-42376]|uniref:hypothetical protein n=1 Tax=Bacillus sp. FJAT-42376 TaxID=2014076 RepID=UPI000F4FF33B|nr:hypothetical protein [Bacillus sp. FJAT-42376]AZB41756.1 hypothetical protein CEF21_05255 [Bacillus sp. FJAT-42376]